MCFSVRKPGNAARPTSDSFPHYQRCPNSGERGWCIFSDWGRRKSGRKTNKKGGLENRCSESFQSIFPSFLGTPLPPSSLLLSFPFSGRSLGLHSPFLYSATERRSWNGSFGVVLVSVLRTCNVKKSLWSRVYRYFNFFASSLNKIFCGFFPEWRKKRWRVCCAPLALRQTVNLAMAAAKIIFFT